MQETLVRGGRHSSQYINFVDHATFYSLSLINSNYYDTFINIYHDII